MRWYAQPFLSGGGVFERDGGRRLELFDHFGNCDGGPVKTILLAKLGRGAREHLSQSVFWAEGGEDDGLASDLVHDVFALLDACNASVRIGHDSGHIGLLLSGVEGHVAHRCSRCDGFADDAFLLDALSRKFLIEFGFFGRSRRCRGDGDFGIVNFAREANFSTAEQDWLVLFGRIRRGSARRFFFLVENEGGRSPLLLFVFSFRRAIVQRRRRRYSAARGGCHRVMRGGRGKRVHRKTTG
mmetsp:Transcript_13841/g.29493  ORF Transcript_13841/g.29493 Transcript_13841/m.29493 type:complete len:241 (-) Transcript_13841:87-809(-)